jgi:hypothetical protein
MAYENHWLPGFNFNVEEWFAGDRYETLAICRSPGASDDAAASESPPPASALARSCAAK